jgi:CHASE3 domain sensor protein
MFQNELKSAEEIVLTNRVHEVREVKVISEFLQKIFTTSKEEQTDELVGQIKFIREFLAEVQSWIDRKVELERMEAAGEITIDRGTRK